jgi:hypothetical protein
MIYKIIDHFNDFNEIFYIIGQDLVMIYDYLVIKIIRFKL